ncbi:MAG: hypothetical protein PHD87_04720 [Candidatus Cloacimonetes bacterium]|nr:hypothetical protein [Candidatus Cloacimonadota bacterium]
MKTTILTGGFLLLAALLAAATWTGAVNNNWHEPGNWDTGVVPDLYTAAYIPQLANEDRYPLIEYSTANCSSLVIGAGARLYVYSDNLIVWGDLLSSGGLYLYINIHEMTVFGDAVFESGSQTLFYTPEALLTFYDDVTFASGADFSNLLGTVKFAGSSPAVMINLSTNLRLNNLVIDKPQSASENKLTISDLSREDFTIGNLTNLQNSKLVNNYDGEIHLTLDLIDQNTLAGAGIRFDHGVLVSQGAAASLYFASTHSYLNKLCVGSGHLSLNSDIVLKNHLLIFVYGVLEANTYKITLAGDWYNEAGPDGFWEESGTVEFNSGMESQYFYNNEVFNQLVVNSNQNLVIPYALEVTCASYSCLSGGIALWGGSFTALDLGQDQILGDYNISNGSTVTLHQDAAGSIDFCAQLQNSGSVFRIHGGSGDSHFHQNGQGSISLTDSALLDFVDHGFDLGSFAWCLSLDNSTLRTSGNFLAQGYDLLLNSGQIELYGANDANLGLSSGSYLNKLVINKASGVRANTVSMTSSVRVNDYLLINSGTFDVNGNSLLVMGNLDIHGSLKMTTYASLAITGDVNWHPGSQATIGVGDITCGGDWLFAAGCAADLSGSSVSLYNATLSNIHAFSDDANFGSLALSGGGTVLSFMGGLPLIITGDLQVNAPNTFNLVEQVCQVSGNAVIEHGAALNVGDGGLLDIQGNLSLAGSLITEPGYAQVDGIFSFPATGYLEVEDGLFKCDHQNPGLVTELLGQIYASHGVFEFSGTSVRLDNDSNTFNQPTFRAGVDFRAISGNSYEPVGGSLRLTGSSDCEVEMFSSNFLPDLYIDKQGDSCVVELLRNADATGDVYVNSGTLLLDGSDLSCEGSVLVGGILQLGPRSELRIMGRNVSLNELKVLSGGTLRLLGDAQNSALVSRIMASGYYSLKVENGGSIGAAHAIFEYLDEFGVNVQPGSLVDPDNSFYCCTFRNGRNAGTLLTVDNDQQIEIWNAVFPTNTWGGAANATKNLDQGRVLFINATGDFAGEEHDSDPHSHLYWVTLLPVSGLQISYLAAEEAIRLDWDPSPDCDHYNIYRSWYPDGPFTFHCATSDPYYLLYEFRPHQFFKTVAHKSGQKVYVKSS